MIHQPHYPPPPSPVQVDERYNFGNLLSHPPLSAKSGVVLCAVHSLSEVIVYTN